MLIPVSILNSSPDTCDTVPLPADAMMIFSGVALAYETNWGTVLAWIDRDFERTRGSRLRVATGAKSLTNSNLRSLYKVALIAFAAVVRKSVCPSGADLATASAAILLP